MALLLLHTACGWCGHETFAPHLHARSESLPSPLKVAVPSGCSGLQGAKQGPPPASRPLALVTLWFWLLLGGGHCAFGVEMQLQTLVTLTAVVTGTVGTHLLLCLLPEGTRRLILKWPEYDLRPMP